MLFSNRLNLLFFAGEGASSGGDGGAAGVTSADAGQSAGDISGDAGQSFEDRLAELNVPKDKIRKGAYKNAARFQKAQPAAAPEQADVQSGAADRRSWDEVRAEYKSDFDAEVQNIVQQRVKKEQERAQQYVDRDMKLSPMIEFFAKRYGLDAENLDYDQLLDKFKEDNSLSQERAVEMGTTEEVAHKLDLAEIEEQRQAREKKAREQQLADAFKRQQVNDHFTNLQQQAAELQAKIPGFNLMAELENDAFAELTRPGSKVSVEQAYYALHPEFREAEAQSVAQRATQAVASSVRAGQSRPAENGTQAASVSKVSYRNMSKQDREALKQRIYAAGQRGEHLPYGG